jgi:hypothetical protein
LSIKLADAQTVSTSERFGNIPSRASQSWLGTPALVVEVLIFAAHKPVDQ